MPQFRIITHVVLFIETDSMESAQGFAREMEASIEAHTDGHIDGIDPEVVKVTGRTFETVEVAAAPWDSRDPDRFIR